MVIIYYDYPIPYKFNKKFAAIFENFNIENFSDLHVLDHKFGGDWKIVRGKVINLDKVIIG